MNVCLSQITECCKFLISDQVSYNYRPAAAFPPLLLNIPPPPPPPPPPFPPNKFPSPPSIPFPLCCSCCGA